MTTDQLLIPRIEVKIEHPHSPFKKGEILTFFKDSYVDEQGGYEVSVAEAERYTDVFRACSWYEHRDIEDMPEYITPKEGGEGEINKVEWKKDKDAIDGWSICIDNNSNWFYAAMSNIMPATLSEYTAFLNQQNK